MALEIEVVSKGLIWWRSGSGEWPKVLEVRMRVFIGLKIPVEPRWWQIGRRGIVDLREGCMWRRRQCNQ